MFAWKGDFIFFIILQDILDEMRKELSKLKEELIDGNSDISANLQRGERSRLVADYIQTLYITLQQILAVCLF